MEDATAPEGLFLSLDALIKKNTQNRQQQGSRGGGGRNQQQHSGGRGSFGRQRPGLAVSGGGISKGGRGGGRFQRGGFQQQQHGQQQQNQQQQQQTQRQKNPFAYRRYQQCFMDEETGDVLVMFHKTAIVRITPQGDVTLNSGGFHTDTTLKSFNDVLPPIGVKVSAPEPGHPADSQWLVSDGRSLFRFTDGMTLISKGPQHAARGPLVLQGFNNPDAAVASAASNAAAAAVGILPKNAPGVPLELGNPKRSWSRNSAGGGGGGGFGGGSFGGGGGFGGFSSSARGVENGGGGNGGGFRGGRGGRVAGNAGGGYGRGFGGGRGYSSGRGPQQHQQQQQQQWQDMEFEEEQQQYDEPRYDEQPYYEEPEPLYGSGGMRADGYDPEDLPGDVRGDDSRMRSRLRAQGRL